MKRSRHYAPQWSPAKDGKYWNEWKAVRAVKPDLDRHAFHVEVFGEDKSHVDFTNDDFDAFLAACKAITEPGNLQAQLDALNGRKKRLLFGITRAASPDYVAGIVARMRSEGKLKASRLDMLDPDDLEKVRIAITQGERRHKPGWDNVLEKRKEKRAAAKAKEARELAAAAEPDPF